MRVVKAAMAGGLALACLAFTGSSMAEPVARPAAPPQAAPADLPKVPPAPAAQQIEPGPVLVLRHRDHHHRKAERKADQRFFQISSTGSNDVPDAALRAYHHAADVLASADPGCDLSWTFLAAIGRVESDHGRYGGAQISSDGVSRPVIIGPRLDGSGPFGAIQDTDDGRLDRDPLWDHAVGQMQFLPATWGAVASDGDGDGVRDPDDIDDSALAAAHYVCRFGYLGDSAGMARAAYGYNPSDYYAALVLAFEQGYRTGVFALPSPPAPDGPDHPGLDGRHVMADVTKHRPRHRAHVVAQTQGATPPAPKPAPKPSPKPTPTPPPTPTPAPPALHDLIGTWSACGSDLCVDTTKLDLGGTTVAGHHAAADFDGDGTVETNAEEFAGLEGAAVHLQVADNVVYVIAGHDFRNADGSFA